MLSPELWGYHRIDARNETAKLNIRAIRTLRAGNTAKFRFLVLALFTQALGVLLLGAFAVAVIANSPPASSNRYAYLRRTIAASHGELH